MSKIGAQGWMIMVVEDDDDERELLRSHLAERGCEVVEARDGEEAIKQAERCRPDLILMDIGLPKRSGISATYKILKNPSMAHTPVVAVTGYDNLDLHRDALAAGCRTVLDKPLSLTDFDSLLVRFLSPH